MVHQISSTKVPSSFRDLILSNIIVGGGNTLIDGFGSRLKYELTDGGRLTDQVS